MGDEWEEHVPKYATAPQNAAVVLLIAVDGEPERRISIGDKPCYTVGRNPSLCDIPVEIRNASRVHCCLAHDEEGNVHLVDLNSGHGTQLDGVELGTESLPLDVVLKPGVPFQLAGDSTMTFKVQLAGDARRSSDAAAELHPPSDMVTASSGGRTPRTAAYLPSSPSSSSRSEGLMDVDMGEASGSKSRESSEGVQHHSPWTKQAQHGGGSAGPEGAPSPMRGTAQREGRSSPPRQRSGGERERGRERPRERGEAEPSVSGRSDRRYRGGPDRPDRPDRLERGPVVGRRDRSPLPPMGGGPGRDGRRLSPPMRREDRRPFPPDRRLGPPPFDRREGFPPFRGGRFPPPDPRDRRFSPPPPGGPRGRSPPGPRGRMPPFRRGSPDYGPEVGPGGRPPPRRSSPDYTDAGPLGRGPPRRGSPDYTDAGPVGRVAQRRGPSPDCMDGGPPPRRRGPPSPSPERGMRHGEGRRGPSFGERLPPHMMPRAVQRGYPGGDGARDRPRGGPMRRPSHSPPPPRDRRRGGGRSRSPPPLALGRGGDRSPPRQPLPQQQPQPTLVASNPADAAALVRQMMGGAAAPGGGSGLTVDQKKRLLWGGKKEVEAPEAKFGANRWDAAEFGNEEDRRKFIKLMGVRGGAAGAAGPQPSGSSDFAQAAAGPGPPNVPPEVAALMGEQQPHVIMKRDVQEQVLGQLEREFTSGLKRLGDRTRGLGL